MLHSYFERKYDKILTFDIAHAPNFGIIGTAPLISTAPNIFQGHLLEEIQYIYV